MSEDGPLRKKRDRRGPDRPDLPLCEKCGNPNTKVNVRHEYVAYLSCDRCGHVFGVRLSDRSDKSAG